jgi:thioredoxin-like negative regulator of GroEL
MIARGVPAGQVIADIEGAVAEPTPSVRFMLATALYEAGEAEAAEPLYAAVVEAQPTNGGARLALAETLLSTRRYAEAAAACAAVADDDAFAVPAARSELFARVLGGRGSESETGRSQLRPHTGNNCELTEEATARAARRGLPAAELDLFVAWPLHLNPLSGNNCRRSAPYPSLDPSVVDSLATMLEALLRVEEFEAFEALLPALAATGLPARRRHSILAEIYLRRGFLESAADEWAASCEEEGPDAEALGGLARVAAAQGLTEDAEIFEKGALELASSSI